MIRMMKDDGLEEALSDWRDDNGRHWSFSDDEVSGLTSVFDGLARRGIDRSEW